MEKLEPSYTAGETVNGVVVLETAWQFLKRLKIQLPYGPEVPLLGLYPREMKTYVDTKLTQQSS